MTDAKWPVWKLAVLLYPFTMLAVAINLYLAGLIGLALGLPPLAPVDALIWALPLGVPATWAAGRWVRSLLDEAEG